MKIDLKACSLAVDPHPIVITLRKPFGDTCVLDNVLVTSRYTDVTLY